MDYTNEQWAVIPNFSSYMASDMGRLKTFNWKGSGKEAIIKPALTGGYLKTMLKNDQGQYKSWNVHKWIAFTFLGPRPDGYEINHIDGVKTNNVVANLEYVTKSGNLLHAYRLNLMQRKVGEKNGNAKLSNQQVREIRAFVANSGKKFYGRKALAEKYGVSECTIKEVVTRRKNKFYNVE